MVKPTAKKVTLRQDRLQAERREAKVEKELRKTQRKGDNKVKLDEEAYVRGEWWKIQKSLLKRLIHVLSRGRHSEVR